jgi:ceramide synthetase
MGLYVKQFAYFHIHSAFCIAKYVATLALDAKMTPSTKTHHVVTIMAIGVSWIYSLDQIGLTTLLLTSASTPFLALSKSFKHKGQMNHAKVTFIIFSCVYFVTRIILFPLLLSWPIYNLSIDSNSIDSNMKWILSNIAINSIYAIQLYWFPQIVGILLRHKK